MKKIVAAAGSLALIAVVSCGRVPANRLSSIRAVAGMVPSADQGIASTRQGGDRTLQVRMLAPADATYTSQSIVHRWVSNDVVQYQATLAADGQTLLTTPILVKSGQSVAVFDHLKLNVLYTVTVLAMGNDGGDPNAALVVLNTQSPATGAFSFSGDNDVSNDQSINIQVQLDSVVFDGSSTVSVGSTDGSYANPGVPESGSAWGPASESVPSPSPVPSALPTAAPSPTPSASPVPSPSASSPTLTGASLSATPSSMGALISWSGLDLSTPVQTATGPQTPNGAELVLRNGQSEFLGFATSGSVNLDMLAAGTYTAQIMAAYQSLSATGQEVATEGPVQSSVTFAVP